MVDRLLLGTYGEAVFSFSLSEMGRVFAACALFDVVVVTGAGLAGDRRENGLLAPLALL